MDGSTQAAARQREGTRRLQEMAHAYKWSGVLAAAVELGVFTAVSKGAHSLAAIAARTGLGGRQARALVDACVALGLLEKNAEDDYRNAPDVERYLVEGARNYIGPWVSRLDARGLERWRKLAAILRGAEPLGPAMYEQAWRDVAGARRTHAATFSVGLGSGYRLAREFDFSPYSLLLDLGGGSGCYCIAAASTHPHLRAVVMDYPPVCEVAGEFIARYGLSDRISTHPGDLVRDPYPAGADVMLLAGNLPNFRAEALKTILRKAHAAMRGRGALIIVGEALNAERTGPLEPALWSLEEVLVEGGGEGHSVREVQSYLEEAGFGRVEVSDHVPGTTSRIVAYKE